MMDITKFGEIVDEYIEKSHIQMIIDMPGGTQDVSYESNCGAATIDLFGVMKLYVAVFTKIVKEGGEAFKGYDVERFVKGSFKLLEEEIIEKLEEVVR